MIEFLDKDKVKNIIDGFSRQYNLSIELDEQLKFIVDDYKEKKNIVKVVSPREEIEGGKDIEIELKNEKSTDTLIQSYHIIDK
jgi:hypothetical protein